MACYIPPLKKAKKQGEIPLPSLGPIPLKNVEFREAFHSEIAVSELEVAVPLPVNA